MNANQPRTSLVPDSGRAGFFCAVCKLSFTDNIQYLDHLNSGGHLARAGVSRRFGPVTVSDVRERLEKLARNKNVTYNIHEEREAAKRKYEEIKQSQQG